MKLDLPLRIYTYRGVTSLRNGRGYPLTHNEWLEVKHRAGAHEDLIWAVENLLTWDELQNVDTSKEETILAHARKEDG